MSLWSWMREVIAYQGEHAPVPIRLERGPDGGDYVFRLGVRAGLGGQETARLPIHHRMNEDPHPVLKEIYSCEVAGRTLEAANLFALRDKVAALLDSIAPARTLPLAYFRVPAMDYELPVYEDDGEIVSPVLSGPKLKAADLAGIRRAVCRYLTSAGDEVSGDRLGALIQGFSGQLAQSYGFHLNQYLAERDVYVRQLYQPADRYWLFQSIEAAIFLGLSLLCVLVAIWLLRRRPV